MKNIEIKTLKDAISIEKDNKTKVAYYIFDEYEIHLNIIAPHAIQEWHYHRDIEEVILVTKGELLCAWMEQDIMKEQVIAANELVQVKNSIHTFSNPTDVETEFIAFRLVLDGKDKRKIIKNDKVIVNM